MNNPWFANQLLRWHKKQGRHDLPWQQNRTPYTVWLSEIMLQQTQVTTVIPYYLRFIENFPTLESLACAPIDDVLSLWAGLGYYARARHLHRCAQIVAQQHQGAFPSSLDALMALPGIGRSTAGAILAQAFNQFAVILDGNVKRVLCRFYCLEGDVSKQKTQTELWRLAHQHTPKRNTALYTQAIMDLGATLCTRSKPNCEVCPVQLRCRAYQTQSQRMFPQKKLRKQKPVRHTYCLLLRSCSHVLLQKRPDEGIWGGLWSLPEFNSLQALRQFIKNNFNINHFRCNTLADVNHSFSHYHLIISPKLVTIPDSLMQECLLPSYSWLSALQCQRVGLPAPISKILRLIPWESS